MIVPIRVVLAEDHTLLRSLLRRALSAHPDIDVEGEASSGREAVQLVRALRPDVLVLDVGLAGGTDGVEVAAQLAGGRCRVLAHSAHSDPVHVAHLLRAGAAGYLSKEAPVGRIADVVRAVAAGESRWFESGTATPVRLNSRELAALRHLARGGRPATLASALGTTSVDARAVLDRLCERLGASSWYEAVAQGWSRGLVGRVCETVGAYSIRVKVPGHASSASIGSYGA